MSSELSNETSNTLLQGSILRSLIKMGVPVIFANLLQSGYIMIDAFWVGRLGDKAVAAISVSQPIIFLAFALGIGLSIAGTTLVAQCIGARLYRDANDIAAQVFMLSLLFSIPISVVGYFLAPWMLHTLGTQDEVFPLALSFLRVLISGLVFTFGFAMLQSLMRGAGEVRIPLLITLGTLILNAIMDPLFIFGYGIIPAFGVTGAGIATLINQCIAMVAGFWALRFSRISLKIYFRAMKPRFTVFKSVVRLGMPSSIELCAHALSASGMMSLVTGLGTAVTAAYGVVNNINALVIVPAIGMSIATATLVGQNIGAGKFERARAIGRLSATISFLTLTMIGLIGFAFTPYIIGLFAPEQTQVINHGTHFFHIIAPSYGLIGLQMALNGAFRATGRTMTTMTLALISQWLVQIPLAWGLSHYTSLGISGLWWAFPITNLLIAAITIILFERIDWESSRLRSPITSSSAKQPDTA
ncbi:solanimycin export family MATE transporter SolL [Dickeya solani]|uniref:Multidrug-efflux transporter n=1 Tax=Dickeya solani TaxID=1089444 RepID=A0ABU4EL35_9GAMM|nr:solanimycin export family MATE transporter SolL [Dickeya solani]MCA6999535.1 MATE family efflux transporter [Dickeya solani]MCZ0823791.1 MATE family efflux transporter [Dickeya solani]MDV6993747.1 solanimycin export family MATE transporter SolL [Dickeya solani]MDV7005103.1 solanimycin export family MATE transporter SolL [Dickeya solani]MDV7038920.1 solanimycin export family MATE transporter SolL [Dickeya solani]